MTQEGRHTPMSRSLSTQPYTDQSTAIKIKG